MARKSQNVSLSTISIDFLASASHHLRQWQVPHPRRPFWRLYWNETPGAWIAFEERQIELDPNRLILIAPDTPFQAFLENPVRHWHAHFTLGPGYDEVGPLVVAPELPAELQRFAVRLCHGTNPDPIFHSGLLALAGFALGHVEKSPLPLEEADLHMTHAQVLMRGELARKWSNRELAARVNYSTNAFIRRFTQFAGISPQKWLRRQRINQARILLEHSQLSIEEIAAECGFADRYHLSRSFSTVMGMGPATYRRSLTC